MALRPAANAAPAKLALLYTDPTLEPIASLLTAELSKQPSLALVERAEINRILAEQNLAGGAGADYAKLGGLLSADGLAPLELQRSAGTVTLHVRLVAARPGVSLVAEAVPWPIKDVEEWCRQFSARAAKLALKLTVLRKDAVPISVLGLRAAVAAGPERILEHDLTLLLIHRLTREKEIFVLERRHLHEAQFEQQIRPEEESAFWTGRYLLEGTLNKEGVEGDKLTISARLISPQGSPPMVIEVEGKRSDPAGIIDALAGKVMAGLKRSSTVGDWRPLDEANQFYEEARWALRWDLVREAQVAAESACAMGKQSKELCRLRVEAYCLEAEGRQAPDLPPSHNRIFPYTPRLRPALRALEVFLHDSAFMATQPPEAGAQWCEVGFRALGSASELLRHFHRDVEMRWGNEDVLAELRSLCRQTAALLSGPSSPFPDLGYRVGSPLNCSELAKGKSPLERPLDSRKYADGSLWFEHPAQAVQMFRTMMDDPAFPPALCPEIVGWTWRDRIAAKAAIAQLVSDLKASTNPAVRINAALIALGRTPGDPLDRFERRQQELFDLLWQEREKIFSGALPLSLFEATERMLRQRYRLNPSQPYEREPFKSFQARFLEAMRKWSRQANGGSEPAPPARPPTPAPLPPLPDPPGDQLVQARFKELPFPTWRREISDAVYRHGKLWLRFSYAETNGPYHPERGYKGGIVFASLDLQRGEWDSIPFPPEFGSPTRFFEVTADSLWVGRWDQLKRFRFREKDWQTVEAPIQNGARITEIGERLYLTSRDSILELTPRAPGARVLASARRRPPLTLLDSVDGYDLFDYPSVFPGPEESIRMKIQGRLFAYWPRRQAWTELRLPSIGSGPIRVTATLVESGVLMEVVGPHYPQSGSGVWNDPSPLDRLVLWRPGGGSEAASETNQSLSLSTWPTPWFMAAAWYQADGENIWAFIQGGTFPGTRTPGATGPLSDSRHGTLLRFEKGLRLPLSLPVRFERDGQPLMPFRARPGAASYESMFWISTPMGQVVANQSFPGFFLIKQQDISPRFDALRPVVAAAEFPSPERVRTVQSNLVKPALERWLEVKAGQDGWARDYTAPDKTNTVHTQPTNSNPNRTP